MDLNDSIKCFWRLVYIKKTVAAYERDKALTLRTKLSILISVSAIMTIGAYFSQDMPIALIVMGIIWVAHIIALAFIIKTKKIGIYIRSFEYSLMN